MNSKSRFAGFVTLIGILASFAIVEREVKATPLSLYTLTDLGAVDQGEPTAINESGDVVGYKRVGGHWHALQWKQNVLTDLGTFGGSDALAFDLNDAGQIALTLNSSAGLRHALLTGTVLTDIGPTNGYSGPHLNNAGDAAGETNGLPYIYSGGTVHVLPTGPCGNGTAHDLNAGGIVVGTACSAPAVWQNGVYQQLIPPSGIAGYEAYRVNAAGEIAGNGSSLLLYEPDGHGGYIAHDLGSLTNGGGCSPLGITDAAVILGGCGVNPQRAVIWDSANGLRDLNDLAAVPPGVVLETAYGATSSGVILARGILNGQFRAYLLTPSTTISSASASPNELWPPDHKMVSVKLTVSAFSGGPVAPVCQIAAVTSNEPITVPGETDFVVTGPLTVQLRAERAGAGAGRTYTISVRCTSGTSPTATRDIRVTVPHDRSK